MLENILTRKGFNRKTKISVKSAIAVMISVLAVGLPQLVHLVAGASGGMKWLPMYLPVLLGGCLMGWKWGLGIGVASPVVSYVLTSLYGNPMPAAERLPFMIAELAVFAAVSGMFSAKITDNVLWAFPAVIAAETAGRAVFIAAVALFGGATSLTVSAAWAQVQTGFAGLIAMAAVVPVTVAVLARLLMKQKKQD